MFEPKILDDLVQRLSAAVPPGMRTAQADLEKNLRAILQSTLSKLDLVTREEFDVQSKVLARSREKLETLEKIVAELEEERKQSTP